VQHSSQQGTLYMDPHYRQKMIGQRLGCAVKACAKSPLQTIQRRGIIKRLAAQYRGRRNETLPVSAGGKRKTRVAKRIIRWKEVQSNGPKQQLGLFALQKKECLKRKSNGKAHLRTTS